MENTSINVLSFKKKQIFCFQYRVNLWKEISHVLHNSEKFFSDSLFFQEVSKEHLFTVLAGTNSGSVESMYFGFIFLYIRSRFRLKKWFCETVLLNSVNFHQKKLIWTIGSNISPYRKIRYTIFVACFPHLYLKLISSCVRLMAVSKQTSCFFKYDYWFKFWHKSVSFLHAKFRTTFRL